MKYHGDWLSWIPIFTFGDSNIQETPTLRWLPIRVHTPRHGASTTCTEEASHHTSLPPPTQKAAPESHSKPGIKMVDPEPCFRKYKGGHPQLFLAGIVPNLHRSPGFEHVALGIQPQTSFTPHLRFSRCHRPSWCLARRLLGCTRRPRTSQCHQKPPIRLLLFSSNPTTLLFHIDSFQHHTTKATDTQIDQGDGSNAPNKRVLMLTS